MDLGELDIIVNYSIDEDPETYTKRMGRDGAPSKVISLVTPLDFGSFHFLKKTFKSEFIKCELPSGEDIAAAKFKNLCDEATAVNHSESEEYTALLKQITDSDSKDVILAYLLHNTLAVIPELKQSTGKRRSFSQ